MVLIFTVLIGLALDFAGAKPADTAVKHYASRYDHINVETILNNKRMVNYYSACLLSKGPCPPEGVEFKRILSEALETNCGRCTEKQATVALRAIRRLKKEYPKVWFQLSQKWDPDDIYVKKFENTFGMRTSLTKPLNDQQPSVLTLQAFGDDDDEPTDNSIGGTFKLPSTTSHQNSVTNKVITTSNIIPLSSTISTTTTTDYPYPSYEPTSLVSTAKTPSALTSPSTTNIPRTTKSSTTFRTRPSPTSTPSSTTSFSTTEEKTSTRLPIIPGLLPINTFFTNPPIPVRPIINLNIGANIGATVKAIKQVERIVAGLALEKLGFIKNMFLRPMRRTRRKYS